LSYQHILTSISLQIWVVKTLARDFFI